MSERGGARPGAGRKKSTATIKTRAIADKMAAEGLTPLEVMIMDMRAKFASGDIAGAADRARDCAPYMHPRLSSANVAVRQIDSVREISDGELAALAGAARAAEQASGQDRPDSVHGLH